MEYFLVERPEFCIKALVTGGSRTCGVERTSYPDGRGFYYAGNFFYTTCGHVKHRSSPVGTQYTDSEMWLGRDQDGTRLDGNSGDPLFMNLFSTQMDLYEKRIWRDMYASQGG